MSFSTWDNLERNQLIAPRYKTKSSQPDTSHQYSGDI